MCGGGEEMAVVGTYFVESRLDGGYDVNGVPGADGRGLGQASRKEFNLAKNAIGYWNQLPSFVREVVQEKIGQFCRGFLLQRTFARWSAQASSAMQRDEVFRLFAEPANSRTAAESASFR